MNVVQFGGRGTTGKPDNLALPSNSEAEQAFLGAMLVQNDVYAQIAGLLTADHFYAEINRRVFEIASKMIGEGRLASPITVRPFIGEHDLGAGMTIPAYLARLAAEAGPPISALDYALCIRDLAVRRDMLDVARDLEEQAFDAPVDVRPAAIASGAMDRLAALAEDPAATRRVTAALAAEALIARSQAIRNGEVKVRCTTTGFHALDKALGGGYLPGNFYLVAGRPGMGKTVFFTTSAVRAAEADAGVHGISLEVPQDQTMARVLAEMSYLRGKPITFQDILRGHLDDDEIWRLGEAQRRLSPLALTFDCTGGLSASDVMARIRSEKKRRTAQGKRLEVAFVDHIGLVRYAGAYVGQKVQEVSELTAALKAFALNEDMAIVGMSQLNRAVEAREDKRPGLSDLRDSGSLEQDADVIIFLYRDAYYLERSPKFRESDAETHLKFNAVVNEVEAIVGKNRSGPVGTHKLFCDVGSSKMADKSGHDESEAMF